MPTIDRFGPWRIGFFPADEPEPAHVHVRRERKEAKFWLVPTVRLEWNEGFARHELNDIRKLILERRLNYLERWNEYFHTKR